MKPLSEQFPISTFKGETQKQLIEFVEKKIKEEREKIIEWIENSEWDGEDINAVVEYLKNSK